MLQDELKACLKWNIVYDINNKTFLVVTNQIHTINIKNALFDKFPHSLNLVIQRKD